MKKNQNPVNVTRFSQKSFVFLYLINILRRPFQNNETLDTVLFHNFKITRVFQVYSLTLTWYSGGNKLKLSMTWYIQCYIFGKVFKENHQANPNRSRSHGMKFTQGLLILFPNEEDFPKLTLLSTSCRF